jgi:hypothetical protein
LHEHLIALLRSFFESWKIYEPVMLSNMIIILLVCNFGILFQSPKKS